MWGLMSALGLGVLAHDKYKKSKIPPYGTYEYYHYAHPEMTDFQICKLRNEMSGEITDAEVKVLFDAGIPLGMWHKDKQPVWDKLAKEKAEKEHNKTIAKSNVPVSSVNTEKLKAERDAAVEKSDEISRICNEDNLVYKNQKYKLYLDRDVTCVCNVAIFNTIQKDFVRNNFGNILYLGEAGAKVYVDDRIHE